MLFNRRMAGHPPFLFLTAERLVKGEAEAQAFLLLLLLPAVRSSILGSNLDISKARNPDMPIGSIANSRLLVVL